VKDLPHLGARVSFWTGAVDPFPSKKITGEVIARDSEAWLVAVKRDQPWATADAAYTWLNGNSVELL